MCRRSEVAIILHMTRLVSINQTFADSEEGKSKGSHVQLVGIIYGYSYLKRVSHHRSKLKMPPGGYHQDA